MNVVVMDRRTGEVTCEQPVFADGASATENSLIAIDGALVVENNYGYKPAITSTTAGRTTTPGLTAIDAGRCQVRWSSDIHIPSLVSKATTVGGLVLTYTKPPSAIGVDAWYFTAVDLATGDVVWTRRAGSGTPFNNHYAAAYLHDGDLFVGTVNGLAVLRG
jgi:outer membrane protein assembly factor BamB